MYVVGVVLVNVVGVVLVYVVGVVLVNVVGSVSFLIEYVYTARMSNGHVCNAIA